MASTGGQKGHVPLIIGGKLKQWDSCTNFRARNFSPSQLIACSTPTHVIGKWACALCLPYQTGGSSLLNMLKIDQTRRPATANRSRISTRGRPSNNFRHSPCILWFLFLVQCTGRSKKSEKIPPPWDYDIADPLERCSYSKFGRCWSDHLGVGREVPKLRKLMRPRPLDEAWLTLRNTLLSYMC